MSRSTVIRGSLNPAAGSKVSTDHTKRSGMCSRDRDLGFYTRAGRIRLGSAPAPSLKPSLKVPLNPEIQADPATVAVRAHRGWSETATVAVSDVSAVQHT